MLYIALEGFEYSGKSTLIEKLKDHYKNDGRIIFVREPGGTSFGEDLRELIFKYGDELAPLTEFQLFNAARTELVDKVITKALMEDKIIISDRSIFSSIILQHLRKHADISVMDSLARQTVPYIPNMVFNLITNKETLETRVRLRNENNSYDRLELFERYNELTKEIAISSLNYDSVHFDGEEYDLGLLEEVDSFTLMENNTLMDLYNNYKAITEFISDYRNSEKLFVHNNNR